MKRKTFILAIVTAMILSGCSNNVEKSPEAEFKNPINSVNGYILDEPLYYMQYNFEGNDTTYKYADDYHNGMAPVSLVGNFDVSGGQIVRYNGKWGFINNSGELVVPMVYSYVYNYNDYGIACVGKGGNVWDTTEPTYYGYIDKEGNEIIPIEYDVIGHFIDSDTVMAIKIGYGNGGSHSEQKNDSITIYNYKGEVIKQFDNAWCYNTTQFIPYVSDNIYSFHNNRAIICVDDNYYLIDSQGNIIKNFEDVTISNWSPFNEDGISIIENYNDSYNGNYYYAYINSNGDIISGGYADGFTVSNLVMELTKNISENSCMFNTKVETPFSDAWED